MTLLFSFGQVGNRKPHHRQHQQQQAVVHVAHKQGAAYRTNAAACKLPAVYVTNCGGSSMSAVSHMVVCNWRLFTVVITHCLSPINWAMAEVVEQRSDLMLLCPAGCRLC